MNTIKIPGFKAEASLYQTSGQRHAANQPEHRTSEQYFMAGGVGRVGGVVPQQPA
jgi:hypothetical protein